MMVPRSEEGGQRSECLEGSPRDHVVGVGLAKYDVGAVLRSTATLQWAGSSRTTLSKLGPL